MIREALEYEKEAISSSYSALWKDKSVRKRLLLAFILNAGQQITGQGTLNTYSTTIYKKVFTDPSQIALINALNATLAIFFTLNAAWTADRFGRKFLFIVGAIGMGICMIIVAAVGSETPTSPSGAKSVPVGIAVSTTFYLSCYPLLTPADRLPVLLLRLLLQALVGCLRVDLDRRDLLHVRPRCHILSFLSLSNLIFI